MLFTKRTRQFLFALVVICLLFLSSGFFSLTHARSLSGSNYPVPTLRLPFNGSYRISGNSYGCGDHVDARNNGGYDDSYAIDFGLKDGQQVVAATSGIVENASMSGGIGTYVYVENTTSDHHTLTGYVTEYGHLSQNSIVSTGTWVTQGTLIGYSGHTGNISPPGSAGAHLHFVLRAGFNGSNLFGNSTTGAYSIVPEPMSGYVDFKYYGNSSARGTAPNNCQTTDTTTTFSSSNPITTRTIISEEFPLTGISWRSGDNNNPQPNWAYVETQVFNTSNQMVADVESSGLSFASRVVCRSC